MSLSESLPRVRTSTREQGSRGCVQDFPSNSRTASASPPSTRLGQQRQLCTFGAPRCTACAARCKHSGCWARIRTSPNHQHPRGPRGSPSGYCTARASEFICGDRIRTACLLSDAFGPEHVSGANPECVCTACTALCTAGTPMYTACTAMCTSGTAAWAPGCKGGPQLASSPWIWGTASNIRGAENGGCSPG